MADSATARSGPVRGLVLRFRGDRAMLRVFGSGVVRGFPREQLVRHARPNELIYDWLTESPLAVVVACGSKKLDGPATAGSLYTGSYHRLARQAAQSLVERHGGRVLIVSAKHGLVDLEDVLDPYDVRLGDADAVSPVVVRRQLAALQVRRLVALTPSGYTTLLRAGRAWVSAPLEGSRGLFEQRGRLARIRDGVLEVPVLPGWARGMDEPVTTTPADSTPGA